MAERKSGPVKPPVIDLKARDASQPAETPKPAASRPATARPKPEDGAGTATVTETTVEHATDAAAGLAAESRPEPVRPIPTPPTPTPPTPPPPVRQARLAMPWSAISLAAGGGAVLGTLLTYLLVNILPLPSSAPMIADPTERLAELDSRLATMEGRVPAMEEAAMDTQLSLDATIAQMDKGLGDARTAFSALEARIAEVQGAIPAATNVDLGPITTQLETLESRVTAIGAGASSADASALAEGINAIETSLATLSSRLDAADARLSEIDTIRADLTAAKAAIAAQTQTLGGANIGPAVRLPLVVSGLETAFAAGRPFGAELDGLRALLPDLMVPADITAAAETGLTRPDALATDFTAAVPVILAGRAAESTGDWGKDAIEWVKGLLALRPTGEMEGNSPEAIVSRLEAAMERRDFVAAAALLEQLPEPMQTAAGDVAREIRAHAIADGFVAGLRAQALSPSAEATP